MCFNVHHKHKNIKTAKKDIICYKIFFKHKNKKYFESIVQGFKYEKGCLYYEKGLNKDSKIKAESGRRNDFIEIGLHSYDSTNNFRLTIFSWDYLVKCIIPKGAKYYYNPEEGEYVSDHLWIGEDFDIIKTK